MNTTELKAAESALETALDQVRQLIASKSEPETKPEPVRGPLTVAPEIGAAYWTLAPSGIVLREKWTDHVFDRERLALGNIFASEREAEFAAKHKAIWAMPIGEWQEDGPFWCAMNAGNFLIPKLYRTGHGTFHRWLRGEVAFTDEGASELDRRITATRALFKEYGL